MIAISRSVPRFAAAMLLAGSFWLAGIGEGHATGLKCSGVPAAGRVTSNPISCVVTCARGGTLAAALALRPRTTSTLTVTIKGICHEADDSVPGGVTLQGAAAGDGLSAPSSSANPVLAIRGNYVFLNNLTITGGVRPLWVLAGGAATGNNLVISGGAGLDVLVNGILSLNNPTIENSAADGIDADFDGTVYLDGGTVEKNAGWGVFVAWGATVDVFGGAVVSNNTNGGALAKTGGSLNVGDGAIENNPALGIELANGGVAQLNGSSAVVQSNALDGVQVFGGSLQVFGGVVTGNSGNGISVFNSGTALLTNGAEISSNAADGVFVEDGTVSVGSLAGSATIESNGTNGIYLRTNSVATFGNSGNQVVNNTGWGVLCAAAPGDPLIDIDATGGLGSISGNGAGQNGCSTAGN